MRRPGIEPGAQRWQRWILPLNHRRLLHLANVSSINQVMAMCTTNDVALGCHILGCHMLFVQIKKPNFFMNVSALCALRVLHIWQKERFLF